MGQFILLGFLGLVAVGLFLGVTGKNTKNGGNGGNSNNGSN